MTPMTPRHSAPALPGTPQHTARRHSSVASAPRYDSTDEPVDSTAAMTPRGSSLQGTTVQAARHASTAIAHKIIAMTTSSATTTTTTIHTQDEMRMHDTHHWVGQQDDAGDVLHRCDALDVIRRRELPCEHHSALRFRWQLAQRPAHTHTHTPR
jgi:hypothetical protein